MGGSAEPLTPTRPLPLGRPPSLDTPSPPRGPLQRACMATPGPPSRRRPATRTTRRLGCVGVDAPCPTARAPVQGSRSSSDGVLTSPSPRQLANAYQELGKELGTEKLRVVGGYTLGKVIGEGASPPPPLSLVRPPNLRRSSEARRSSTARARSAKSNKALGLTLSLSDTSRRHVRNRPVRPFDRSPSAAAGADLVRPTSDKGADRPACLPVLAPSLLPDRTLCSRSPLPASAPTASRRPDARSSASRSTCRR